MPDVLPDFVAAMALLDGNGLAQLRFAPVAWSKVTDDVARLLSLFALGGGGEPASLKVAAAGLVEENVVPNLLAAVDAMGIAMTGDAA